MDRLKKYFILIPVLLILLSGLPGMAQQAPDSNFSKDAAQSNELEYTGEWIIQLAPGIDTATVAAETGYEFVRNTGTPGFVIFRAVNSPVTQQTVQTNGAQLEALPGIVTADPVFIMDIEKMFTPGDPYYPDQWHLNNTGQSGGTAGEDARVFGAWNLPANWPVTGYDGTGVQIGIADDGLQYTHPDLNNWDATRSYNYNADIPDPAPTAAGDAHGTSVGGVAAARPDSKCGVGAAYEATLSGQKFFGPNEITNVMIGDLLGNTRAANPAIDISNNSWGYSSGAIKFDPYQRSIVEDRIANGRGGLGQIYVFSNGNGLTVGSWSSRSEFNGSRYTIAISATDHNGIQSWYSEGGANVIVNAPSSGGGVGVTTTDLIGANGYNGVADTDCTNDFGGTSSSAPLTSGIIALMLDANPNLTWRDVQHVLINTADQNDPANSSWAVNGAGYNNSEFYGFGRVDATQAVTTSAFWNTIPNEISETSGVQTVNAAVPDNGPSVTRTFTFNNPTITSLEHVTVNFNATTTYRDDLGMLLTSPSGTTSTLAVPQIDNSGNNSNWDDFPFTTSRFWGEDPTGTWTISVRDGAAGDSMTFNDYEIVLYGTTASNAPQFADIELQQSASSAINTGTNYTHTLTVNNLSGSTTRNGFSVEVLLPAGVNFNGAIVDNGGSCAGTAPTITCTWATSSFTTATADLDLTVSSAMTPGTYDTVATATLAEANDLNTVNNAYITQTITYNPGYNTDVNNDGITSPTDVIYVINRLNSGDLSADVDNEGDVDMDDVQIVLSNIGN